MSEAKKVVRSIQSMSEFFTRGPSSIGVKLPLVLPGGVETDAWLRIRGVDSDEFRLAQEEEQKTLREIAKLPDKDEQLKAVKDSRARLAASLVMGWSFPDECNTENILQLLSNAPYLREDIESSAADRSLFLSKSEPTS